MVPNICTRVGGTCRWQNSILAATLAIPQQVIISLMQYPYLQRLNTLLHCESKSVYEIVYVATLLCMYCAREKQDADQAKPYYIRTSRRTSPYVHVFCSPSNNRISRKRWLTSLTKTAGSQLCLTHARTCSPSWKFLKVATINAVQSKWGLQPCCSHIKSWVMNPGLGFTQGLHFLTWESALMALMECSRMRNAQTQVADRLTPAAQCTSARPLIIPSAMKSQASDSTRPIHMAWLSTTGSCLKANSCQLASQRSYGMTAKMWDMFIAATASRSSGMEPKYNLSRIRSASNTVRGGLATLSRLPMGKIGGRQILLNHDYINCIRVSTNRNLNMTKRETEGKMHPAWPTGLGPCEDLCYDSTGLYKPSRSKRSKKI